MNNKTIYGHLSDFSEEIYKAGYYIEETLKEVYGLAIQMDSFPHPSECDCREKMIRGLEKARQYLNGTRSKLHDVARDLGQIETDVVTVLEDINDEGREDED